MAFDYRTYDLRELFHLRDVALAWCEIDELTPQNKRAYLSMSSALIEAVWKGELQKEDQVFMEHGEGAPPSPFNFTFTREELKQWAIFKGQKPKFLFPEMRDEKRIRQEENTTIKEREIDRACVQAVARTLWLLFPDMTADEIVNHDAILIFCNGTQWEESTLKSWIREINPIPKNKRAGRPRKTAPENVQLKYEDVEK